jgi:hypothetical protein
MWPAHLESSKAIGIVRKDKIIDCYSWIGLWRLSSSTPCVQDKEIRSQQYQELVPNSGALRSPGARSDALSTLHLADLGDITTMGQVPILLQSLLPWVEQTG